MPDHPGPALETYLAGFRLGLATLSEEDVIGRALLFAEQCWRLEGELAAALRQIEELEGEMRRARGRELNVSSPSGTGGGRGGR